jgi:predicted DNA-binding transcriptional regulator AlpA
VDESYVKDAVSDGALSIADAVRFSGQSRSFLYEAMAAGELPYFKRGVRRFVAKRQLIKWLAEILEPAKAPFHSA